MNKKPNYKPQICSKCGKTSYRGLSKKLCHDCYRYYKQSLLDKIPCACNCGELIPCKDLNGKPMRYKKGHIAKGKNNPSYNNGISNDKDYIIISKPDHPNARTNGFIPQHRFIMEQHLGRYLTKTEHVHHRDGNKKNNDISNLQLMKDNSEHMKLEKTILKELISKRICLICKITNIKTRWSKHLDGYICRSCKYKRDGWS